MPKNIYTVTTPDQVIHTRKTDRTYTHAVFYLRDFDRELVRADASWKTDGDNWEFAGRMVEWGGIYGGVRRSWDTDEKIAAHLAKYTALYALSSSRTAAIQRARAERVAAVHAAQAAGEFEVYQLAGWCGRPDLAIRLRDSGKGRGAIALPVERKLGK